MLPKSSYRLSQIESSLFSVFLYLPKNVYFLSNFFVLFYKLFEHGKLKENMVMY